MKNKIKSRLKELFFVREVQLTYDVESGEFGLRESYRSSIPFDKFGWREYAKTLPVKTMKIKHADLIRISKELPNFLDIYKRAGKGKVI